MESKELKKQLLELCISIQEKKVDIPRKAMAEAQQSANEEKGKMGDKFESFREQLQIDRDMYARQFVEGMEVLTVLKNIDAQRNFDAVAVGALVITDKQLFFISASLGNVKLHDVSYVAISAKSPMFQAMAGKSVGEQFTFRDNKFLIKEIQ